jgi:glycosyltransferase involved in cell wall biosynthesis
METVGIVVATFGDASWIDRAKTAVKSAENQSVPATRVVHHHAENLALARNQGADMVGTDWLIFLDADDTLDVNYVRYMMEPGEDAGAATLRQPSTLGIYPDGSEDDEPVLIPERPLTQSNYLVIGTMCRRDQFLEAGGFDPEFPVLEDWDLWLRMYDIGAVIGKRPGAIYRIGVNPDSRNQNAQLHGRYYQRIRNRQSRRR